MSKRPETGPMRFGDDWTGVFIRGDNAFYYAQNIDMLFELLNNDDVDFDPSFAKIALDNLRQLLLKCKDDDDAQQLKSFRECKVD